MDCRFLSSLSQYDRSKRNEKRTIKQGRIGKKKGLVPSNYLEVFENDRPDSDSLITIRNTNGEGGKMKRKSSYRVVLKSSKIVESLCVKEASRREGDDRLVFVLQITVKDEERELKKRLSDIRSLFHQICALFPMLITPVPYPEDIDSEKDLEKAKSEVETYLQGLLECKNLGPLLYSWCSPGEAVEVSESEDKKTIEYAVALSDWEPKSEDTNELRFKEGDHITVLRHDPSGWWFGRTEDGREGQFPVTFVHVFQGGEAEENTTSDLDDEDVENVEEYEKDDDDEEKEEDESVEVTTTTTKKKEYQNEINDFCLNDMDAFDDLCEKGWAISERKNTQSDDSATATAGDNVEVEYAAYIWDGLSTQITKYESTEDMSPDSNTITICVGQGVHVEALEECLVELRAGDSVTLISTPGKGYGPKGRRPKVPGDVHLVFLLTVVSITQGAAVSKPKSTTKSPAPPSKVQSKVDEAMRKLRARRDRIVLENVSKPSSSNKEESKPKPKLVPKPKPSVETRRDARPVVTKQKPRLTTPEKSRQTAEEKEEATPVPPVRRYRKKSADPPASIPKSIPPSLPPSRKDDVVAPPSLPPSRKKDDDVKAPPALPPQRKPDVSKKKKKKKRKVSPPRSSNTTEEGGPTHSLKELLDMKKSKSYHDHIKPKKLETHLHDEEFKKHFGMDKDEYSKLPSWAQQRRKKKVGL